MNKNLNKPLDPKILMSPARINLYHLFSKQKSEQKFLYSASRKQTMIEKRGKV